VKKKTCILNLKKKSSIVYVHPLPLSLFFLEVRRAKKEGNQAEKSWLQQELSP
jgi:hypothetical protein